MVDELAFGISAVSARVDKHRAVTIQNPEAVVIKVARILIQKGNDDRIDGAGVELGGDKNNELHEMIWFTGWQIEVLPGRRSVAKLT